MNCDISLFWLFCVFFYIGLFTIGGGLVAISLMQQTIVERGLISTEQFYNMIAISESTPGPVGVNMATFLGYEFYGIPGAIITSFAEVLPSLITILIIARFIIKFSNCKSVRTVFNVLRPAGTGMIFVVAVQMFTNVLLNVPEDLNELRTQAGRQDLFNWMSVAFYLLFFFFRKKFKVHPFFIVIAGAVCGMIFY